MGRIEKNILHNESLLQSDFINFALGKIYDDCEEWDKAFSYFHNGNKLVSRFKRFPQDDDQRNVDKRITYFNSERIKNLNDFGVSQKLPILIIGMPRSGTTLVEDIMARHSKVGAAGEVSFWREADNNVFGSKLDFDKNVFQLTKDTVGGIADNYVKKLKSHAHGDESYEYITDKMPHNFLWLGLIAGLFPDMPIIHCKRDPMDNCLSIYFQYFEAEHAYAYELKNLGFHYKQYERLMAHWHGVLPGRILDVNYEDVVADPEYWTRKMIKHVGLEWEDGCLEQQDTGRTVKTASIWQVRQPIYKTSVQRWKNYEKHLGPLKEALGYKDDKQAS